MARIARRLWRNTAWQHQAEPIYYDGTAYIATSENDVFAINVDSGQIAWSYETGIDPRVAQPCERYGITSALGSADIVTTVTNGRNTMPPFGAVTPQTDIHDVAADLANELLPAGGP